MTRRYRSIDIIKGVAMIMVILVHYGQNYTLGISKAFQYLQMGCPVFFVASGFGIMCLVNKKYDGALNSKNVKPFYLSRLKALAPGWYVTFIIIFLVNTVLLMVTGKTLSFGSNREPLSIICNLLFINGLLPFCNNNVMPGGWYIGTTVILYALTPLILKGIKETHNRRLFFIFSSIIGMVIWTMQTAIQSGQQRHISRTGKDVIPGHNLSRKPDRKCPGAVEISVLPWYLYSAVTEDRATVRIDSSADAAET